MALLSNYFVRFTSFLHLFPVLCFLLCSLQFKAVASHRCYCTYHDCGSAFCNGEVCLIGFKKEDRSIIYQGCAREEATLSLRPCKVGFQEWDEVCRCSRDKCNIYSYYMKAVKVYFEAESDQSRIESVLSEHEKAAGMNTSSIVALIVCVPFALGLITVVLIMVNYHCKL